MALLGAVACKGSSRPADPTADVIAQVGDRSITVKEFNDYLASALGGEGDVASASAVVKSRLLDQCLDEEMLLSAAMAQGLTVTDDEVKNFPLGGPEDQDRARRLLLQKKFQQEVILKGLEVSQDEIQAYFSAHLSEFGQPARVALRQILLDSKKEAARVRAELLRHPDQFEEIANTRSLAPDGGRPQAIEEEILPDTLKVAVSKLKEGELSDVVEDPQGFFILRLEERQARRPAVLDEVRQQIELQLLRERGQEKYKRYLTELRGRTPMKVLEDRLGFPYMKKEQS